MPHRPRALPSGLANGAVTFTATDTSIWRCSARASPCQVDLVALALELHLETEVK